MLYCCPVISAALIALSLQAAEVRGRVTDESQALIPGAQVAITGPAKRTTVANWQGE